MVEGGGKGSSVSWEMGQGEKATKGTARALPQRARCACFVRSSCFAFARNKHEHDGCVSCGC